MKSILSFLLFPVLFFAQSDPFRKIHPVPEKLELLPLGEVKPNGWIKAQIQQNLAEFTGHLDELAPDLIIEDDIYGKDRLSKKVKSKHVGAIGEGGDWQVQLLWWNSETQSNWRDGYIRSAILADDKQALARLKIYVDNILVTQDKDGYLGIYDEELRYRFDNENGELWAKATLLRGLLAWYDYSRDEKVLKSVKLAVQNTMAGFPIDASHPFASSNENVGELSHGLAFTDVLENLPTDKRLQVSRLRAFSVKGFFSEQTQRRRAVRQTDAIESRVVWPWCAHLRASAFACSCLSSLGKSGVTPCDCRVSR